MAETLRELVVSLSLQSDNFSRNIKTINEQIKEAESEFKAAGAGADGFASSTDGLKTKLTTLKTKLDLQKTAVSQYEKALAAANTALEKSVEKNADLKNKLDDAKKKYGEASDEVKALEGQVSASNKSLQTQADKVTRANTALNNAKAAYGDTEIAIKATQKALDDAESAWDKAQKGFEAVGDKAQSVGKGLTDFGRDFSLYVSAPLAALGGFAYKSAADYEQAFVGVRKTTEATEEEFDALHEGLLELSERTPVGYADLAGTMEISGQLGVEGVDNLLKFTEVMTALGVSTNLGAEQGAESLAKFANITGMSLGDIDRLGSVIVALGNNYATTEADIVSMATRMASSGDLAGLSETDILGLAAALSSVGIEAEAGGSAASKLMKQMQVAAETGDTAFADVMGLSADDFAKAWDEDAAQTILAFFESLSKLDEGGQTSAIKMLDDMGLTEIRLSNLILASTKNTEGFASALETANTAWEENTALMAEAEQFYDTELGKAQAMANRAQNVAADFGDNITEMLKPLKEQLLGVLEWFNSFDEETQTKIITWFGVFAVAGPIVKAVGDTSRAVGKISGGISKIIDLKPQIISLFTNPVTWGIAAGVGVIALLGVALSNIKSDMEIITGKAAAIELKIDEGSKDETLQAIAQVRREIEELSGGDVSEQAAGVSATVKAGYGTSAMYGQALGYESTQMQSQIAKAGAEYQRQIDALNAEIVKAVELGDKTAADALSAQRDQAYAAWDAEVLAIKDGYTLSVGDIVDGMASQYPDAQAKISSAMEQYTALKELDRFFEGANERTDAESRALAEKILGMDGVAAALEEYGYGGMSAEQIYDTTAFGTLALGLRDKMAAGMTDALAQSADSPIYTVLASMLGDTGVVEGLDFSAIDGTLADGIALLDFKAAAETAQEKGGDIGQYLTDGIGAGITGNKSAVNDDLIALRDAVVKQTRAAFEIGSPSKLMTREGLHIPEGVARGISSGAYMVKNAMVKMAREAVQAARSELQIQSPSRTMRDEVGAMIPRGVVKGIEEETEKQQRAVQNAFRSLVQPALAGAQSGMAATNRTNNYNSTVSLAGAIINVQDPQDIRALAIELAALERAQQQALGRVG